MNIKLTPEEKRLVEYAKDAIVRYNTIRHSNGGIDTLYSFLMSDSGKIHDGACYEPNLSHASICGERHAIATFLSWSLELEVNGRWLWQSSRSPNDAIDG